MDERKIHVGTSGWHYDHWIGPFYPQGTPKKKFLDHYINHFRTVEINNSFYQLPKKNVLEEWRDTVPPSFVFAVKASRYITHMKKLKEPKEALKTLFETVDVLGDKLGPVLFQLPPRWGCDVARLESFLTILPKGRRYAFEFRDESWFRKEVYDLLADHNAAFCVYELDRRLSPRQITADFVYVRLHGPGAAYQGTYSDKTLREWAERFSYWRKGRKEIFCYFDNDQAGYAPQDALNLLEIIRSA